MEFGGGDPAIRLRLELLTEWAIFWRQHPELRVRMARTWMDLQESMVQAAPANRWKRVKGFASATFATLLDIGWEPKAPNVWVEPSGQIEWTLHNDKPGLKGLRKAILKTVKASIWARASSHHLGSGLGEGADLFALNRHLRRLERSGQYGRAGMLKAVASGACWPRARRRQAGMDDAGLCPRCLAKGTRVPEDDFHRTWDCPCNAEQAAVHDLEPRCQVLE